MLLQHPGGITKFTPLQTKIILAFPLELIIRFLGDKLFQISGHLNLTFPSCLTFLRQIPNHLSQSFDLFNS